MADKVPLFGAGTHGRSVNVSAQRRVNLYVEVQPVEDRTRIVFYGTAGLDSPFINLGSATSRVSIVVNANLYTVHRDLLFRVDNTGTEVLLGALNTDEGRVGAAIGVDQVLFVDGLNGYVLTPSTGAFAQVVDPDFPNGATTAAWQNGYFLVDDPSTNEFCISTIDDATGWDATERASAEANPDAIVRVMASYGYILLFGPATTELWGITDAVDFPYTRVGGGVIPHGLAAKWSATEFKDGIAGLFTNSDGGTEVGFIAGGVYSKISTPEVDWNIQGYQQKANATGLAYRHSGHSFYQLNFTSADKTWLFDADSGFWCEMSSSDGRHRAEMAVNLIDRILVSDFENGDFYRLNPNVYSDAGESVERELVSRHLYTEDLQPITALWVDMEVGVGLVSGQGSDPLVMLSISKDGGHSYGNEITASIGAIGQYTKRCIFRRLGVSRDWTFKLRISDPVKVAICGEGWLQ